MKEPVVIKHRSKRKYYKFPEVVQRPNLSYIDQYNLFATESEGVHTFKPMTEQEKQYYARQILEEREAKAKCNVDMVLELLGDGQVAKEPESEPAVDMAEFIKSLL